MSLYDGLNKIDISKLKNVAVMGRLEHARIILKYLRSRGAEPAFIFDNDVNKHGTFADGVPIIAPVRNPSEADGPLSVIIYSPKYWEEMAEQLVSLGYRDKEDILVIDRPSPERNLELIEAGFSLYKDLQEKYGEDVQLFLANCPLGDYYLLGLYFREYLRRNNIDNYIMLGESAGLEKLSGWFGISPVIRLDPDESSALIRAWIFDGEEIKLKVLTIWQGAFRHNPCVVRQREGFSFTDTFRYLIYDLPEKTEPVFPERTHDLDSIHALFEEKGMIPGHTVLISPFSYSLPSMDDIFWNELADRIREKGYSIAVNVGESREENMISDSITVSLDFMEIMDFMEYAGTVIGMRSGFFDITSQASCRRFILYPPSSRGMVEWNSTDKSFCSLKDMGLCSDAVELEVLDKMKVIDEIISGLD